MIKVIKKVVFGGLDGFTVYPGTICRIKRGRNRSVIYAIPVNKGIVRRCNKVYQISKYGLTFKRDECVIVK